MAGLSESSPLLRILPTAHEEPQIMTTINRSKWVTRLSSLFDMLLVQPRQSLDELGVGDGADMGVDDFPSDLAGEYHGRHC